MHCFRAAEFRPSTSAGSYLEPRLPCCTAFVPNMAFGIGEPVVDGETRDPVQSPSFGVEVPGEEDPAVREAMMAASAALSMVGESERLETEEAEAARAEKREDAYLKKRARDMINGEAKLLERLDKYAKTRVYRAAEVASEWEAMDQAPARENRAPFDFPTRGEGAASGSGGGGAPAPAPPRGPEHRAPVAPPPCHSGLGDKWMWRRGCTGSSTSAGP